MADLLAEDLRRFLSDRPVLARRSSALDHLRRWSRRNPVVAMLGGAVALLLLTLTIVSTLAAVRLSERRADLHDQLEQTILAKREGQEKLVQARLAQARAARSSGQVGQRFGSLDALTEAARIARDLGLSEERLLEIRNEAVACMVLADLRRHSFAYHGSVAGHDGFWFDYAFENYAVWNGQGRVGIRRLADGRELLAIPGAGVPLENVHFSPDGRSVVVNTIRHGRERQGSCQFWNLATGQKTLEVPGEQLYFTPDGRRAWVWLSLESGVLDLYDLASGRIEQRFTVAPGWHCFALHPDGRQLAESGEQHSGVQIWDTTTGRVTRTVAGHTRSGQVAWHPGGRFLAVSAPEHTIETWDVEQDRRQAVLRGHKDPVTTVVFNSAGDLLASVGWDWILRLWDPMTGKLLLSKEGGARPPQFSRDDRLLGATYSGSQWEIWEVTSGGAQCRTLAGQRLVGDNRGDVVVPGAGAVHSADFGVGGRLLAWSSNNGVGLWDLGKNRQLPFPDIGEVKHLRFDRADGSLITCGQRGLERWPVVPAPHEGPKNDSPPQLQIGPPQLLHPPGQLRQFDLSTDGRRLAVSDLDRASAFILDPRDPASRVVLRQPHLARLAISPDGRWVATGTCWGEPNSVVKVWDASSGACVRDLQVGGDAIVVFSPEGYWLATGTGSEICLWRVGTWERDRVIARHNATGNMAVAFSPDGRVLALARTSSLVQLLALETGKPLASLAVPDPLRLFSLRFSGDGSQLVAGRDDQECHVWDLRAIRKQLAEMGLDWNLPPLPAAAVPDSALSVKVDLGDLAARPDGRVSAVPKKLVPDVPQGSTEQNAAPLVSKPIRNCGQHLDHVTCVALSPDGKRAISGGFDKIVRCWDIEDGKELWRSSNHEQVVWTVALSPDGRRAISGSQDQTLELWNIETGKEACPTMNGHFGVISSVAFLPDGKRALSGCWDKTVRLWDLETGKEVGQLAVGAPVLSVALTKEGHHALLGSNDGKLRYWDLRAKKELRAFAGPAGMVEGLALAGGGHQAVVAGEDGGVHVYDLDAGKEIKTLKGHGAKVDCVALSPDGSRVLSCGEDETLRLWDLASRRELFRGQCADKVRWVAFSSDGKRAVSACYDGFVALWELPR
jgi:WD40 repeat protein